MIGFWISAALMIAAALAFLVPPLVRRAHTDDASRDAMNLAIYRDRRRELESERAAGSMDAAHFDAALAELDRELLRDVGDSSDPAHADTARSPWPAIVVAVALPVVAFPLYLVLGTPQVLMNPELAKTSTSSATALSAAAGGGDSGLPHSVAEMVAGLEARLRESPEDAEGWLMLGRSYAAMNQVEKARDALREAVRQRPDHPMSLVALAEAVAGLQGNRLDGEPIALVQRALEADPGFGRALWLAGVHAFNVGQPARAREHWEALLALPGLSPEAAAQVREAVAQAAQAAGSAPGGAQATAAPAGGGDGAAGASVTVNVSLSPELAARVQGDETLFVFARAAQGPRMPLAIARLAARDLPATVTLDESMAMTPQMTLSTFPQVVVGARISRTGNATPSSGDLEGVSAPLSPGATPQVALTIDQVVP